MKKQTHNGYPRQLWNSEEPDDLRIERLVYEAEELIDSGEYISEFAWLWQHRPGDARKVQLALLLRRVIAETIDAMVEGGRLEAFSVEFERRMIDRFSRAYEAKNMTLAHSDHAPSEFESAQ